MIMKHPWKAQAIPNFPIYIKTISIYLASKVSPVIIQPIKPIIVMPKAHRKINFFLLSSFLKTKPAVKNPRRSSAEFINISM